MIWWTLRKRQWSWEWLRWWGIFNSHQQNSQTQTEFKEPLIERSCQDKAEVFTKIFSLVVSPALKMIRRMRWSWCQHHHHLSPGSWNTPGSWTLGRAVFAAQGLLQASVSAHQVWSLATFCLNDFDFELIFFPTRRSFLQLSFKPSTSYSWSEPGELFRCDLLHFHEFLFPRRVSHQASDTSPFPIVLLLNWNQSSCSAVAVVWWWTSWRLWPFKTSASSSYRAKHSISLLRPLWSCATLQVWAFVRQFLCDNHISFRHPDWSGQLWHKPPKPCHCGLILSWSETFQFRLHVLPPSPCPP